METSNEEMVSVRDFQRATAGFLDRVERGELEKLVLMRHGKMRAVLVSVQDYERMTGDEHGGEAETT